MAFTVTTTGTVTTVVFDDLGARTLTHPSSVDLQLEYSLEELVGSSDLNAALTSGEISLVHNGENVADTSNLNIRASTSQVSQIGSNQSQISANTANIAVNSSAIFVNSTNIAQNTSDIATNAANIAQNSSENSGTVTIHSDVSNAGSGQIITEEERQILRGKFSAISTLSQDINTANASITLTNPLGPNTLGYGIAGGAITIPVTGWYMVSFKVLGQGNNNLRSNPLLELRRNGITMPVTGTASYERNTATPYYSAVLPPCFPFTQLVQGDTIQIFNRSTTSGGSVNTTPQESVLSLSFEGTGGAAALSLPTQQITAPNLFSNFFNFFL